MKKLFAMLLALSLLLPAAVSYAETKTPSAIGYPEIGAQIGAYIAEREAGLASCAVSVFNAEGTVFTGYYGYSDIENGVRAAEETVYEWGSCSKLLVWVSVMQQVERGKIDLTADIRDYLPAGFLTKLQYPEEKITMLNLMAHNAGFQESYYENQAAGPDEAYNTLEDAVRACECYQAYHVGEHTAYSNWGTALAAFIVEQVSGTDYVTYVHENIFAPLGIDHTAIAPGYADNKWVLERRMRLQCYERYADPKDNRDNGPCLLGLQLFPAGAATGTIEDFAAFGQALAAENCPLFENGATRDEMLRPVTFYGDTGIAKNCHGFWTCERGVQTLGHGGNTEGCSANIEIDPASGLGIAVMVNEPGETAFCYGLPELLFGDILSRPEYQNAPTADGRDISGCYRMTRNIVCGAGKANGFLAGICPLSKDSDGSYAIKLFGITMSGAKLIPIGKDRYILRDNGMTTLICDRDGTLEMMSTDLVRFNPVWTLLCFGFIAFGALCLLTVLVKLIVLAVRKKRGIGRRRSSANLQILIQQVVYGVSGVIFAAFFLVPAKSPAFTTASAILAALLGLGSLVNGILLCYNTFWAGAKTRTKVKQYLWAALGAAYAAFIIVMQLYNFWNL